MHLRYYCSILFRFLTIHPRKTSIPKSTIRIYIDNTLDLQISLDLWDPWIYRTQEKDEKGHGAYVIPERHHSKHVASNDHKLADSHGHKSTPFDDKNQRAINK